MKIHTKKHFIKHIGVFGYLLYLFKILGFYKHRQTYDSYLILWNPLSYLVIICLSLYIVISAIFSDYSAQEAIKELFDVFAQPSSNEVFVKDLPKE